MLCCAPLSDRKKSGERQACVAACAAALQDMGGACSAAELYLAVGISVQALIDGTRWTREIAVEGIKMWREVREW